MGAKTQIVVNPFLRNLGDPEVVTPLFNAQFGTKTSDEGVPVLKLALVLSSL
ncbi:hypothetical protein [Phaeovulum veldkampii]|uniref:hypothetical protein n=1 Tax=Phaeovulum veldkampii TaxID=33049 RepID=UPI0010D04823|nr:hypothetical protein [Phaeovulum veldkampii]TDQ60202.1 hypothetical protein EV658_106155 [Phaeovulum veldkampii DSM 11550]